VTGLLRHSISCIITERSNRLRAEAEEQIKTNVVESITDLSTTAKIKNEPVSSTSYGHPNNSSTKIHNVPKYAKEKEEILTDFYIKQTFPTKSDRFDLAKKTGLSTNQIKVSTIYIQFVENEEIYIFICFID
jgi:hypothetical protein